MLRFLSLLVLGGFIAGTVNAQGLLGFDDAGAAAQLELEADFDSRLSAADQEEWLRILSRDPHHVGSPEGRAVVDFVAERFEEWGYDVDRKSVV